MKLFPVLALNLILTVALIAAAFALYPPREPEVGPDAVTGRIADLERVLATERKDRQAEFDRISDVIGDLRNQVRLVRERASEADPAAPPPEAAAAPAETTEEKPDRMVEGFAAMLRQQVRQQRDRFMNEILDPTPESIRRNERRLAQTLDRVAQSISLSETEKADVGRILTQVEERRNAVFRDLLSRAQSPDDVHFEQVKETLDDSFREEDQLIRNTLPPEKAKQYDETVRPFRQIAYTMAEAAFPAAADE